MTSTGTLITVDATLTIDPARAAVSEGGMFARAGIDISGIRAAVAPTARVLATARQAGITIVYLKMGFHPDLSDAGPPE